MKPLVYGPSWSKEKLWEEAKAYISQALLQWNVPTPIIYPTAPPYGRKYFTGGSLYGLWKAPSTIWVNVPLATNPPTVRGRVWSFPGHKTDRTCAGILAHEFGHHILGNLQQIVGKQPFDKVRKRWEEVLKKEKPVTSYEPTADEAAAESARIFILNPDLLRRARPYRYGFIADFFHPLHTATWSEVLANAPEFILKSAEKFSKEGVRRCNLLF